MIYGQKAEAHHVAPDYHVWGRQGNLSCRPIDDNKEIMKITAKLKQYVNVDGMKLVMSDRVEHYQGDKYAPASIIFLRFQMSNQAVGIEDCEHISVVYDTDNNRLLGFTNMRKPDADKALVLHQTALTKAIKFMQQEAMDLIPADVEMPQLVELEPRERMIFEPVISVGNVELNWIANHTETITTNGKLTDIKGMKVKMYIPNMQLWSWVIIDANGTIQTFERNISWNFSKYQRNTQMWLHSKWLMALKFNIRH